MCGQNCQMRRIWSYFWHQTVFPCSFPGTSVLFLYRNVKETVVSFQRVMAAFTTLARFFTNDQVIYFLKDKRDDNWPCRRWTSGGWMTYLCLSPTPPTDGPETRTCWWEIPQGTRKGENSIESTQDQLSMPAAMALNYCCTAACVRDYIKQGLNISCLDYKYCYFCVITKFWEKFFSGTWWHALKRPGPVSHPTAVWIQPTQSPWRPIKSLFP